MTLTFKEAIEKGNDLFRRYPEVFVFCNKVAGFDIEVSNGGFVTITPDCTCSTHALVYRHKDGGRFCLGPRKTEDWQILEKGFEKKKSELIKKFEKYTKKVLDSESDMQVEER